MYARTGNQNRLVLFILIIIAVGLITFYHKGGKGVVSRLERAILSVVTPAQKAVNSIIAPGRRVVDYAVGINRLVFDNRALKTENIRLRREIGELKSLRAKNARLADLAGFRKSIDSTTVAANVISRSPTSWQSLVTIDVGLDNGVDKEMAVVTNRGLVGQVIQATKSTAIVQLIDDRRSGVAVEVKRTGATGVVEGSMDGNLRLRFIASDADVRGRDVLVTSGAGAVYPRGIAVGTIAKISTTPYSLEKQISVEAVVNQAKLFEVLVITEKSGADRPR